MQPSPGAPDMSHPARAHRHGLVSTALSGLDDQRLAELTDRARPLGSGIGGTSALLDVGGVPVFVKRVPLTDLERHPDHLMSTANVHGLPVFCQYGVGSPGFGAWRELAANTMATGWVLDGRTEAFALLHHWRVLPGAASPADEHADIAEAVAYWEGSPAVRERLTALSRASASLVLFSEYIPQRLDVWLAGRLAAGDGAIGAAVAMAESCLRAGIGFMNAQGLHHFDAHLRNILTDGERLYLADLGLATSDRFDLSPDEAGFLALNSSHDACYAMMALVNWLVAAVCRVPVPCDGGPAERNEFIRRCARGARPQGAPPAVAAVISRYAPIAAVMNDFYWDLFGVSRATPYPSGEIRRAMALVPGFTAA